MSNQDIDKRELLRELGYAGQHELLLQFLAEQGLTREGKQRISLAKRTDVTQALAARYFLVCARGDCQAEAEHGSGERIPVLATGQTACEICGGSILNVHLQRMHEACREAGWRKLVVVGGSPNSHQEIQSQPIAPLEIRLVDGTKARPRKQADADLRWADHVVIWGGTQLDHKVSNQYSAAAICSTFAKRSVQELWAHITEAARRRAPRA
ncbi:MAG: hypothetical protein KDC10_02370 [Calditrichaeota bacterium]|nr:hypothetical protein [Candidatus Cloacimonadota bacterium]MCB1046021.1 hypothetical protein [Calditrichota bacterium]